MSDIERGPLYIFWEDGQWVNYKNGIKTVFREVRKTPCSVKIPPVLTHEETHNIFENKEQYNG